MYEKGQEAERKNTERERQIADSAEKARDEAKNALTFWHIAHILTVAKKCGEIP